MSATLTSKHEQLRDLILAEIARLELGPGDRIPSRPFWREHLEVSNDTVDRALRGLIAEGILIARTGSGTFLKRALPPAKAVGGEALTRVIDVLVPRERETLQESHSPHVWWGRLEGIAQACRERGIATALHFINPYRFTTPEELLAAIGPFHDGAVFLHEDLALRLEAEMRRRKVPYAVVSPYRARANGIGMDVTPAYRAALRHLRAQGRTRVAFLSADPSAPSSHLAFVEAASAAEGLPLARVYWCGPSPAAALDRLLGGDLKALGIDALLCRTDRWAFEALRRLREAGVRVPEDVALIGCDDLPEAAQTIPALATIRMPFEAGGAAAVAAVARLWAEKKLAFEYRAVAAEFMPRASALG